jgi:hypothetical protein
MGTKGGSKPGHPAAEPAVRDRAAALRCEIGQAHTRAGQVSYFGGEMRDSLMISTKRAVVP